MEMKADIKGFDEVKKLLDQLPDKVSRRIAQSAVTSAARVVQKEVKKAAPRGTEPSNASRKYGRLRDNIRVIRLRFVKDGQVAARVDTGSAFWALFIEFGTRYIAAKPWFSPAFNNAAGAAFDKMRDTLARRLEKETEKMASNLGANKKR